MRARTLTSLVVVVLLAVAGGVWLHDRGRADLIANGVTISGIDVGGLRAREARAKLGREVLAPLKQPLVVRHGDERFALTARRARLGVDVDGSIRAAVAASRTGNALTRTRRELAGDDVRRNIDAQVTYSKPAVRRLVRRVRTGLERKPVDADVRISARGVSVKPARRGRRVLADQLERRLHRRLVAFRGLRSVRARTASVAPKVSDSQLAGRYPAVLIVDRQDFTLTLYKGLKRAKRYEVAVGKVGMDTPAGLYRIQNKAENPDWQVPDSDWAGDLAGTLVKGDDPTNPIKARWMGIYDGAGIHGTDANDSIGSAASHGCIRMRIPEVIDLYEQVPVDAPIFIA